MSNINDRGTIKWTSLMLPEHVKALNELWEREEYKSMPILDGQQIHENNLKIQCAYENNFTVIIKYFKNHQFYSAVGKLNKIDVPNQKLKLADSDSTEIAFEQIIEAYID